MAKKRAKRANGENTIFYDKSKDCFKGQIITGYYDNGRAKRKSVFGKTQEEVKQKLKQIEYAIYSDDFVDESNITIYHLAKQMIDDKFNYNEISENTYYRHLDTLKMLKDIYNVPLQKANETLIRDCIIKKQANYSNSSLRKMYGILNRTFNEAVRRKIIKENPMSNIREPKSKKKEIKTRALTIDEQKKLLNILTTKDVRYSRQMLISLFSGMRMGEINALTVKDINFTFKTITVNKTVSRGEKGEAILSETAKTEAGNRTISFAENDILQDILSDCVRFSDDYLFTTDNGNLITTSQVNNVLQRLLKKYDIVDTTVNGKVTQHSLRHTYATRCIEAGMTAKVLQKLLGHTDIKITLNTYCDAFESFQNDNIAKVNTYLHNVLFETDSKEEPKAI